MSDDRVDQLMGLVHNMATRVLEAPAEHREELYAACRRVGIKSARDAGMTEEQAQDAGEKFEEWTRALVGIIEAGGAPQGGHA